MKNLLRFILAGALTAAGASAQTTTLMLSSGSTGAKKDLVIIGEGFRAADQAAFNNFVTNTVMNQMFTRDVFRDAMNAFNIYRVNVNSVDSGVTQVNSSGVVTVARNTALDYHYSGVWDRLWMEPGPNTAARLASVLGLTVPGAEYVFLVLNEAGRGGCWRGNTVAVTMTTSADVCAHEMGHLVGNLGDEYTRGSTASYTGDEPSYPNLTTQTVRSSIKWRDYIPPNRPLPTILRDVVDRDSDVGLFEGGLARGFGVYRPTFESRMNIETQDFCPVGYAAVRDALTGFETRSFLDSVFGDFNGDGRDDTVIHNANSVQLFLSDGNRMIPTWGRTGWTGAPTGASSRFLVGDWSGDGRDDLFHVVPGNRPILLTSLGTSFSEPVVSTWSTGWNYRSGDRFYPADFNGDGRTDLIVMNTTDATPCLGLLQSNGSNGMTLVRRYDNSLPGWSWMAPGDRAQVGDFDGDGRDDLLLFNGDDWAVPYLGLYRLTGSGLADGQTYEEFLPGWTMSSGDQQFVGDFNGDGRDDIYVRNNINWRGTWNSTNLAMMASTGAGLTRAAIYSDSVPGYAMARGDRCHVADCDGDGRDDLVIFNATDWSTEYLAILRSTGSGVAATKQGDSIGNWNLGAVDKIAIANFTGGTAADDVVIYNSGWFGLLRSNSTSFSNVRIYPKYIRNVPYHRLGWW
jgi:hypothetical protein